MCFPATPVRSLDGCHRCRRRWFNVYFAQCPSCRGCQRASPWQRPVSDRLFAWGVFRRKRAVHCFIAFLVASLCNCCCMMPFFHAARGNVRGCPTRTTSAVRVWLACLAHGARHNSWRVVSSSVSRHRCWCRCRCRCRVRRCRSRCGTGLLASKSGSVRSWRWRAGLGGGAGACSARTPRPRDIRAAMHSVSLSVVVLSLSVTAEVSIEPQ